MKTFATFAAIALVTVLAPAASAEEGEKSISVSYADLDLNTADGQKELKARIKSAARGICEDPNSAKTGPELQIVQACMYKSTRGAFEAVKSRREAQVVSR